MKYYEEAYFIGLVKVKDYQVRSDGTFKEALLTPFMVYKAQDGVDLKQDIKISRVAISSCDMTPPRSGITEVIIWKFPDGRLDLLRLAAINFEGSLDAIRKKVRYVEPTIATGSVEYMMNKAREKGAVK